MATRIVAWMTALPSETVIGWTSAERPFAARWSDIEVPEICDLLKVAWIWTAVGPADPDASVADP